MAFQSKDLDSLYSRDLDTRLVQYINPITSYNNHMPCDLFKLFSLQQNITVHVTDLIGPVFKKNFQPILHYIFAANIQPTLALYSFIT